MKSAIVENWKKSKREFPLIAKTIIDGTVVLFQSEHCGTVLCEGVESDCIIGNVDDDWHSCFDGNVWQILDSITITFKL